MSMDLAALERRIDALESRGAIERLIADYAHGFDRHDERVLRAIWHEDALLDLGESVGRFEGAEAIMRGARAIWEKTPVQHHWMANARIDLDGDTAFGDVALDCLVADTRSRWSMLGGRYEDRYERRGGPWAIAARRFELDYFTRLENWAPIRGR
jgi:ketosteroid isomerase-like protein